MDQLDCRLSPLSHAHAGHRQCPGAPGSELGLSLAVPRQPDPGGRRAALCLGRSPGSEPALRRLPPPHRHDIRGRAGRRAGCRGAAVKLRPAEQRLKPAPARPGGHGAGRVRAPPAGCRRRWSAERAEAGAEPGTPEQLDRAPNVRCYNPFLTAVGMLSGNTSICGFSPCLFVF